MESENEYLLKIAIVGTPKKQIDKMIYTITDQKQSTHPIGIDMRIYKIRVDDQAIKLILVFDVKTQYFRASENVGPIYRNASAVLIGFDKSDLDSYTFATVEVPKEIKKYPTDNLPITLVGFTTESDAVSKDQVQSLADKLNYSYFETISTDKKAIKEIMVHLARQALAAKGE